MHASFFSATGGVMPSPATTSAAASAEVIQGAGRPPVPPRPGAANVSSGYGSYGAGKQ